MSSVAGNLFDPYHLVRCEPERSGQANGFDLAKQACRPRECDYESLRAARETIRAAPVRKPAESTRRFDLHRRFKQNIAKDRKSHVRTSTQAIQSLGRCPSRPSIRAAQTARAGRTRQKKIEIHPGDAC